MEPSSMDAFLAYWARIHGRTRRLLDPIPDDRLEWTWRQGAWTVGDLIRHLAALERYMFAENAAGRPSRYRSCGEELASGKAAVIDLFERLNAETVAILASLGDARLQERCVTPGGAELSVAKWLRAMVEHHAHHRGQLYLYLSMLGVETPPLYGLTAEAVADRGVDPS